MTINIEKIISSVLVMLVPCVIVVIFVFVLILGYHDIKALNSVRSSESSTELIENCRYFANQSIGRVPVACINILMYENEKNLSI